jgi:hypothetical protein
LTKTQETIQSCLVYLEGSRAEAVVAAAQLENKRAAVRAQQAVVQELTELLRIEDDVKVCLCVYVLCILFIRVVRKLL